MILLCERCFAPIDVMQARVSLAHIDRVRPDGSLLWVHTYLHTTACVTVRPVTERPDVGAWNPERRVGARRL